MTPEPAETMGLYDHECGVWVGWRCVECGAYDGPGLMEALAVLEGDHKDAMESVDQAVDMANDHAATILELERRLAEATEALERSLAENTRLREALRADPAKEETRG